MARLDNAGILAKLSGDNRTVVAFPDQTTPDTKVVASDVGLEGSQYGLDNAKTATVPAYTAGVALDAGEIDVQDGDNGNVDSGLTKEYLRTQYFHTGNYDSTKVGFGAKRCFVNSKGQPLAADGTVTSVTDAVDADQGNLTNLGEGVTNYAQTLGADTDSRTPVPGVYEAPSVLQTALYAPYPGYTVQHDYVAPVIP